MAFSTPSVTSRVFAHGSFSTMSISPWPPLITASPISGWWSILTSATSFERERPCRRPSVADRHLGEIVGAADGELCAAMFEPLVRLSIMPPVPM